MADITCILDVILWGTAQNLARRGGNDPALRTLF
ncbi:hypothetical protein M2244_000992 [Rhodoferax antarcticus]|nr:hypothetical protein [Rhodoferax antarcticus]